MKRCNNCNAVIRDEDKYCRNCGIYISGEVYSIMYNIFSILIVAGIVFFILLFIASYFLE